MTHSLNEIEALSKRAARGAGLSWGMAEEAGKAARWLAAHRLPGVALLAGVLARNDGVAHVETAPRGIEGMWRAPSGVLCPLAAGALLSDCAGRLPVEMERVSHPLLLAPFAGWAARRNGAPVTVSWRTARVTTDGAGLWIEDPVGQIADATPAAVSVVTCARPASAGQTADIRGTVCAGCWNDLGAFAHRTYAPATQESRLLGAGAGVADND